MADSHEDLAPIPGDAERKHTAALIKKVLAGNTAPYDASAVAVSSATIEANAALKELVDLYLPSVYTFCVRYTGSTEDAQDAAQETFLKAWKNLKRFDKKKSFRTWLFAIAKNSATDLMRKRKSVPFSRFDTADESNVLTDTLADTEPLPEEVFEQALQEGVVQNALSQLSARDQTILSLRYQEEQSFEDISHILRMSPNTVRSLHRRALISLRKLLDPGKVL